ncbi:MAG: sialate O-acetylesterase [Rikenellaceae bacterium]
MRRSYFVVAALALFAAQSLRAEVTMGSIWGDGMVLQRNAELLVGGKSDGESVTVTTSWSGKSKYRAAVVEGQWSVEIPTPESDGTPHTMTFDDGDRLTLSNILLGDVWLLMGQSNMQMPMSGFGSGDLRIACNYLKHQHVEGAAAVISRANPSQSIRLFTAEFNPQRRPQERAEGAWQLNTPEAVRDFSATGYFFGKVLQESLDIPIGLVSVNRGASTIETWMSREVLESVGITDLSVLDREKLPNAAYQKPCYLYNGMVAPLKGVSVAGAIWYQGESNMARREEYLSLFPAFVAGLRSHFRGGEFPLYYAQIAPFCGDGLDKFDVVLMRETMVKLMDITPRTGMVALTDIGESEVHHPRFKREVGERLAMWALADKYAPGCVDCRAPEYRSMSVTYDAAQRQKGVALSFDYATTGFHFAERNSTSTQFEIAGEDRVFYPAQVKLINNKGAMIWVWCKEVAEPVAARYAFHNYADGDLFNAAGMAVSSFRTDDWECE